MQPAFDTAWIRQLDPHGSIDVGLLEGGFGFDY
jgi:hypothetical protein